MTHERSASRPRRSFVAWGNFNREEMIGGRRMRDRQNSDNFVVVFRLGHQNNGAWTIFDALLLPAQILGTPEV